MAKATCSVNDCRNPSQTKGLCSKHYQRLRTHGDPLGGGTFNRPKGSTLVCSVDGCPKEVLARDWCGKHYQRWLKHGDPLYLLTAQPKPLRLCAIEDCERPQNCRGWCSLHYKRWLNHGSAEWEPEVHKRPPCSIPCCDNTAKTRGWCGKHYAMWFKHGDPMYRKPGTQPGEARAFFDRMRMLETDDCVIWEYGLNAHGYGKMKVNGKDVAPHTLVLIDHVGPKPDGKEACHSCNNRPCFNYRHLRWDTPKGNGQDKLKHGTNPAGERNIKAKLTPDDVRSIRADQRPISQIAADYPFVRKLAVYNAKTRRSWKHLD